MAELEELGPAKEECGRLSAEAEHTRVRRHALPTRWSARGAGG